MNFFILLLFLAGCAESLNQPLGKKMPFSEPHPVKAAPMRFKDNATTNIQYLDVDQGLTFSYVTDVYEDKKGNLWFSMDAAGVNKYDSINITNYTEKEGVSNNECARLIIIETVFYFLLLGRN